MSRSPNESELTVSTKDDCVWGNVVDHRKPASRDQTQKMRNRINQLEELVMQQQHHQEQQQQYQSIGLSSPSLDSSEPSGKQLSTVMQPGLADSIGPLDFTPSLPVEGASKSSSHEHQLEWSVHTSNAVGPSMITPGSNAELSVGSQVRCGEREEAIAGESVYSVLPDDPEADLVSIQSLLHP